MDPVMVLVLMLFALFTGGAGHAAWTQAQTQRVARLREALLASCPDQDGELSVFDLFWDLGASELALEIMASRGMLPAEREALPAVFERLREGVREHGGYARFVQDMIETLDELEARPSVSGAQRRALPTLANSARKLLPAPEGHQPDAQGPSQNHLLGLGLSERIQARDAQWTGVYGLGLSAAPGAIDADALGRLDPAQLLGELVRGSWRGAVAQLKKSRALKAKRAELDEGLRALYLHVAREAAQDARFFDPLYDAARRWERDAWRLWWMIEARRWAARPFAFTADVLMREAYLLALALSQHARANADEVLDTISRRARRGEEEMAGYVIYLNRYAFFAGRGDAHAPHVRKIEFATARLKEALAA